MTDEQIIEEARKRRRGPGDRVTIALPPTGDGAHTTPMAVVEFDDQGRGRIVQRMPSRRA